MFEILSIEKTIICATLLLSCCFIIVSISNQPYLVFILLPFIGSFIALSPTNVTVIISETAESHRQGYIMGLMLSLRVLGNALICVLGGVLAGFQLSLPILIGAGFGGFSIILFLSFLKKTKSQQQLCDVGN